MYVDGPTILALYVYRLSVNVSIIGVSTVLNGGIIDVSMV